MPSNCFEILERIKQVEREYKASRLAMDRLIENALPNPMLLRTNLNVRDLTTAAENLETTYFIRLFSEFEAGLRDYWEAIRQNRSPMRTQDLISGTASRQRVIPDLLQNVHNVREYRNRLVHRRDQEGQAFSLAEARGYLCRFVRFLPPRW